MCMFILMMDSLSFDVICFSENDEIFISLQEPKDRCLTLKDLWYFDVLAKKGSRF